MCIERNHPRVSVRRQCRLLSLARSNLYYQPTGYSVESLCFMTIIHCPAGACRACCREGISSSWKRHGTDLVTLSRHCCAILCRAVNGAAHAATGSQMRPPPIARHWFAPQTMRGCATFDTNYPFGPYLPAAKHHPQHKIYPYLLRRPTSTSRP